MHLFFAFLGCCCFVHVSSNCSEWELPSSCAQASDCSGFSGWGARALGLWASAAATLGLSSCGLQALGRVGFSGCSA